MVFRNQRRDLRIQFPARRSAYTVLHRKIASLLRVQIVLAVRIPRRKDILRRIALDFLYNRRDYGTRLRRSECAVNKVALHIYNH